MFGIDGGLLVFIGLIIIIQSILYFLLPFFVLKIMKDVEKIVYRMDQKEK